MNSLKKSIKMLNLLMETNLPKALLQCSLTRTKYSVPSKCGNPASEGRDPSPTADASCKNHDRFVSLFKIPQSRHFFTLQSNHSHNEMK